MKKDFLNVSPDTGGGGGTGTVTADPNLNFASRTTTLNFNADGEVLKEVEALQFGNTIIPQFYLSPTVSSGNDLWGLKITTTLELEEFTAGAYNFLVDCTANNKIATEGTAPNVTICISVINSVIIPSGGSNINNREYDMYYSKDNGTKTKMTVSKDEYSQFISFRFIEGATFEELTVSNYRFWLRNINDASEIELPVRFRLAYHY